MTTKNKRTKGDVDGLTAVLDETGPAGRELTKLAEKAATRIEKVAQSAMKHLQLDAETARDWAGQAFVDTTREALNKLVEKRERKAAKRAVQAQAV